MISLIVPTYNAFDQMAPTIASLDELQELVPCEVIFVDDCSTDDTVARLREMAASRIHWTVVQLPQNSGSAAVPRNTGLDRASGDYVFFLDADDVIIPTGLKAAYDYAVLYGSDAVRNPLSVVEANGKERLSDRVPQWDKIKDPTSRLRAITKYQSLTCSFLFKRSLVEEHSIRFIPERRIGEDITFTAEVLSKATKLAYRDVAIRKYVKSNEGQASVTQKITSRNFRDFYDSWRDVQVILERCGVSFLREHGYAAMDYAVRQFALFRTEELAEDDFTAFGDFCNDFWNEISSFPFAKRWRPVIEAARDYDRPAFERGLRPHLLIAGHDLKFILDLKDNFSVAYDVRIDKWSGHVGHEVETSEELLEWADIVWVEWLLGAAVWYSKRVDRTKRLIIRMHRSEIEADYGLQVDSRNVSRFVAIAPHTLRDFSDRFDIPRSKISLIPNYFHANSYMTEGPDDRVFRIAMVGIVPALKGFHRAIELLAKLREKDDRYTLRILGKRPEQFDWVMKSDRARRYYESCETTIDQLGLRDAIEYVGWVDTKTALSQVGFVLSLSDYEGMQVSPGEAFCAEAVGLFRPWRGVEACYPEEFVMNSADSMIQYILEKQDTRIHREAALRGKEFIATRYGVDVVFPTVLDLLQRVKA